MNTRVFIRGPVKARPWTRTSIPWSRVRLVGGADAASCLCVAHATRGGWHAYAVPGDAGTMEFVANDDDTEANMAAADAWLRERGVELEDE